MRRAPSTVELSPGPHGLLDVETAAAGSSLSLSDDGAAPARAPTRAASPQPASEAGEEAAAGGGVDPMLHYTALYYRPMESQAAGSSERDLAA